MTETNWKQAEHLMDLGSVDFVRKHLQQQGVAPYLVSDLGKRVQDDVATVQRILKCDELTAIAYITRGSVAPEPSADPSGGERSAERDLG